MEALRDDFCAALDSQILLPTSAIVVLRNWDARLTRQRIDWAVDMLLSRSTPLLLMTYDGNTYEEAVRLKKILSRTDFSSITIVTHRSHHYRAYLTFLKVFGNSIRIYSSPVEDRVDMSKHSVEFRKIEEDIAKGHLATYEEGIQALE